MTSSLRLKVFHRGCAVCIYYFVSLGQGSLVEDKDPAEGQKPAHGVIPPAATPLGNHTGCGSSCFARHCSRLAASKHIQPPTSLTRPSDGCSTQPQISLSPSPHFEQRIGRSAGWQGFLRTRGSCYFLFPFVHSVLRLIVGRCFHYVCHRSL